MTLCVLSLDAYVSLQRTTLQPAELRRQVATLSLARRSCLNPGHILHDQLTESQAASKKRLKSRYPIVPATRILLHNLSTLGFRTAQWKNLAWDTEYSKNTSALCVYISKVSTTPIGMSLTRTAWVKLNRLGTGVVGLVRPCTNGVSLLQQDASVALVNKLQTTLF